ncbi:MAG: copper chaperone [Sediminicola sp.]|jgi:copper chaperone CopZ|tara:strand:+ start:1275 stop:1598 length:324 start_codon:yes stop_codon:yes gene_type:complete
MSSCSHWIILIFAEQYQDMKTTVIIQNLKCAGCMGTITKNLSAIADVADLHIELGDSAVSYTYASEDTLSLVQNKLAHLGYPVVGDKNTVGSKAKSYVSCAIGKMGA